MFVCSWKNIHITLGLLTLLLVKYPLVGGQWLKNKHRTLLKADEEIWGDDAV